MNESNLIAEKLDVVIRLLALNQIKGKEVGEQIIFLSKLGIPNKDISDLLEKSQNTVNVTLSQYRRKKIDKEK